MPKIIYQTGNVVDAAQGILLHGCNAKGVMGSGVAAAVRKKWPGAYEVYRAQHDCGGLLLGDVIWYTPPGRAPLIANGITQFGYGRDGRKYVDYTAVRDVLRKVNTMAIAMEQSYVAMPRIGAGLGGGDWKIIEALIEKTLFSCRAVVYDLNS